MSKILITSLLTGFSALPSAEVTDDWNEKAIAGHAFALVLIQPFPNAQTEGNAMSVFMTAYQNWKNEQKKEYRMGTFPRAQEHAIIGYVERGECAVLDGLLFGVGWHHIPDHAQYADEDVLGYGKSIDALVEICETIKEDRKGLADGARKE